MYERIEEVKRFCVRVVGYFLIAVFFDVNNIFADIVPQSDGGGSGVVPSLNSFASIAGNFFPLMVVVVIFYFLILRPQQKKAKEHKMLLASIKKGDSVVSVSGLYGVVAKVDSAVVHIEIAKGVVVKMQKDSILSTKHHIHNDTASIGSAVKNSKSSSDDSNSESRTKMKGDSSKSKVTQSK